MLNDMESILLTEEQIRLRVMQLGTEISRDYQDKEPLFIGVLKGCFVFMADLMRQVTVPCGMDFMVVSSYGKSTNSTGAVEIIKDLSQDIQGRHLVIVEDILDTGITLSYLTRYLSNRDPASISIATLLDKPERRRAPVSASYVGFTVPDAFVVGYGLDYAEKYRNLPFIGILKPEIYS